MLGLEAAGVAIAEHDHPRVRIRHEERIDLAGYDRRLRMALGS